MITKIKLGEMVTLAHPLAKPGILPSGIMIVGVEHPDDVPLDQVVLAASQSAIWYAPLETGQRLTIQWDELGLGKIIHLGRGGPRGGGRPRKEKSERSVRVAARLTPETHEKLKKMFQPGESLADFLERIAKDGK